MNGPFEAVKISDKVYWVGAVDWVMRDFHGYSTRRGTTYNAYLVLADRNVLIDTVKAPFKDEMLSRIASVIDPGDISYVISNHSEMDHSGCLTDVVEILKPEKVFASPMGVKALTGHFAKTLSGKLVAVKDGESLDLGNATLSFTHTPMLHWPDSMFTYLVEDALLFSQDAFGMHLASDRRFADEIDDAIMLEEATRYYGNILMPFSPLVLKLIEKVGSLGIKIDTIAPDHGPIWRKDPSKIIGLYANWARQAPTMKAVIIYDTMWNSTATMARAIADGLVAAGAHVRLLCARTDTRAEVATEILDAGALIVGSPTINNQMFPTLADVLTYLKGLKPRNLIGAAFGSYGWSGEAVKLIEAQLEGMKIELAAEGVKTQYVPDERALTLCHELGKTIAKKLTERCDG